MTTDPAIADFWRLFTELAPRLAELITAEDAIYDRLLAQLHRVDSGLFIEVSADSDEPGLVIERELVITADGNSELFALADAVVAAAPRLPGWSILALKPRQGFPESVTWEGVSINIADVVFDPITPEDSSELVLQLFVPGIGEPEVDSAHNALLRALDHALGEREFAASVQYTEVVPLHGPGDDYIPLLKLEEFLKWHNRQRAH
jgi:hypothetical protein